jgi:uncharacterized membrane protein YedE/YeeE
MTGLVVWPGWIAGALIGGYLALQYVLTGKALGCSSGYGNLCGLVTRTPYFRRGEFGRADDWRLWFAVGLPLGGLIAALSSGVVPAPSFDMGPMYEAMLPAAGSSRALFLVGGGMLIGLGARMAGGCQSGHTINGLALLNPPSLLASVGFFAGGLVAVQVLFRLAGGQ